jgi:signal transduction histidine kinase
MTVSSTPRRTVLIVLVLVVAVPLGWVVAIQLAGPDDGTLLNPHLSSDPGRQWRTGVRVDRVHDPQSPLRPDDIIVAVDGRRLATLDAWQGPRRHAGDVVRYTYLRDGKVRDATLRLHDFDVPGAFMNNVVVYALPLVLLAVAMFVFVQRPRDRAAQLMLALAVFLIAGTGEWPLGLRAIDIAGGRGVWPYIGSDIANALMWGVWTHFAVVFPQPPRRLAARPRLIFWVYLLPFALYLLGLAISLPQTHVPLARLEQLTVISEPASRVVPIVLVILFVLAYRRTTEPAARQRLRYVIASLLGALAIYVAAGQLPDVLVGHPLVGWDWLQLTFVVCPVALAAAILRYGLFDIQVILKKWLVFGLLTASLLAIYLGTLSALTKWFPRQSSFVALVAGGFVAMCFHPLRARLQRWVSGLIYGARDDPYQVVSQLGRLDAAANPNAALRRTVDTLARTLRLSYVAVELETGSGIHEPAAVSGRPRGGDAVCVALGSDNGSPGRLLLEVMPGREPFGPADRRLLEDVAYQVGRVADLVLLNSALQESRTRIVTAREEERRRLHRDLHDGIGPTLAAQGMQLEVARTLLDTDRDGAGNVLALVAEQNKGVIAEVRRVVDDLRPRTVDQLGLVSAIRERCNHFSRENQCGSGLPCVDVVAPNHMPELPAAVEVAAYRIATEAVTNAARHGRATMCHVQLAVQTQALIVEIRDDGVGLPTGYAPGVGIASMRERAAELGGQFSAARHPAGGTIISATLPIGDLSAPTPR